jgi:hypothetical protein
LPVKTERKIIAITKIFSSILVMSVGRFTRIHPNRKAFENSDTNPEAIPVSSLTQDARLTIYRQKMIHGKNMHNSCSAVGS